MTETQVGSVYLGIHTNPKAFKKELRGIEKLADNAGKKIGKALAVGSLVVFGKKCLELGSDLSEVQNVVDTVFPSMNKNVDAFSKKAAKSFGLSETMSKKYVGNFGAMASAFGFTEKQAYDMSTTLTGLAGDIASFYNITQDEAYTKLKAIFSGETESLKELGIVMTQSALDAYALANGFGKTTSAMSEMEKVSLRYAFVQSQLTNAAGDFAKTSQSWANQVRILSLQFDSFKASIGQGLINVLTPAIQWFNLFMEKAVAAGNAFKRFTEVLTGKKKEETSISSGLNNVSTSANNATEAVSGTVSKAKQLKRMLAGFDQITKVESNESENEDTGSTSSAGITSLPNDATAEPINGLSKAYGKLSGSVDKLRNSFSKFSNVCKGGVAWTYKEVLKPLGEWTIDKLGPVMIDTLCASLDFLAEAGSALKPTWQWVWDNVFVPLAKPFGDAAIILLESLAKAINWTADAIERNPEMFRTIVTSLIGLTALSKVIGILNTFKATWLNTIIAVGAGASFAEKGSTFLKGLEKLGGNLGKASTKLMNFGKKFATTGKGLIATATKIGSKFSLLFTMPTGIIVAAIAAVVVAGVALYKNWDTVKEKLNNAIESIKKKFREFIDGIKAISGKIAEAKESIKNKWEEIRSCIQGKTAEFKAKVATKWEDIKATWNSLTSNIKDKTANMKATVASKWADLKTAWNNLLGNFKDKAVSVTLNIAGKVADIKKWFNEKVIDKVNEKIHKVPLLKSVSIPHLAEGGYVKKNTPQLALIGDNRHQGEVVAPEQKLLAMAREAVSMAGGNRDEEMIALLKQILLTINAMTLVAEIDGNSLKNLIVKLINNQTRATGMCELVF